jgi:hypothetical protein
VSALNAPGAFEAAASDGAVAMHARPDGLFLGCIPLAEGRRYGDDELRRLDPAGCCLSLLGSGRAPILADHYQHLDSVLGVVAEAWREGEALFLLLRFAPFGRGVEAARLIEAGIVSGLSLGYRFAPPDGAGVVRGFTPYEVSLVSLPRAWSARVVGPSPEVVPARIVARAAESAAGTRADWRDWAARAAGPLAERLGADPPAVAAALAAEIDAELMRHADAAAEAARRRLGM